MSSLRLPVLASTLNMSGAHVAEENSEGKRLAIAAKTVPWIFSNYTSTVCVRTLKAPSTALKATATGGSSNRGGFLALVRSTQLRVPQSTAESAPFP